MYVVFLLQPTHSNSLGSRMSDDATSIMDIKVTQASLIRKYDIIAPYPIHL